MLREIIWNYSYSIECICLDKEIALQNALRYKSTYTLCIRSINEAMSICQMNLFYFQSTRNILLSDTRIFSDKYEIFQRIIFFGGGELPLPRATTPLCRGGVGFNLTTRNTGYPGTRSNTRRVPGYKNTRKSEHYCRRQNTHSRRQ